MLNRKTIEDVAQTGCLVFGYPLESAQRMQWSQYYCVRQCAFDGEVIKITRGFTNFPVGAGTAILKSLIRLYATKYGNVKELQVVRENLYDPFLERMVTYEYLIACSPKVCERAKDIHKQFEKEMAFANQKKKMQEALAKFYLSHGSGVGIIQPTDNHNDILIVGEEVQAFWNFYQRLEGNSY